MNKRCFWRINLQKVIHRVVAEDIQNYTPTVMFRGTPCIL